MRRAALLAPTAGPVGPAVDQRRRTSEAMRNRGAPHPCLDRVASSVAAWLAPARLVLA